MGIFIAVAFIVPALLSILMAVVFKMGNETGMFTGAWMFFPASGVMLGQLFMKKNDPNRPALPKGFIINFLIATVVMILICVAALFFNGGTLTLIEEGLFVVFSISGLITLFAAGKERRKAYGLNFPNAGKSIFSVCLYVVLFFALMYLSVILDTLLNGTKMDLTLGLDIKGILSLASLIPSMFLLFIPYFGEEYGWRYFLGPILQKKFGKRIGILLLGVIWGLWHLPINIFFYSPDTAAQSIAQQVFACIGFAAFFTWAYMYTEGNIWALTAIHFLNNNMGGVLTQSDGSNITVTWASVLLVMVLYGIIFLPFYLSKRYSKKTDNIKLPA